MGAYRGVLMRVRHRRVLVSTVLLVGLVVPSASTALASPDAGTGGRKEARLQEMQARPRTAPAPAVPSPGGRLSRLAVERGSGKVVISVKLRAGSPNLLAGVASEAKTRGGHPRRTLKQLNTVSVEMPETAAAGFTARMRQRREVERVDVVARRSFSLVPNDQQYPATEPYLNAVAAPQAWDAHEGDPGVAIAVVDSGVDVAHPDLAGRVTQTYNAVNGGTDVTDEVGHGTFVAGVAAATGNNGIGIAGASMGASVMAVKVADSGGEVWSDAVASGVVWSADHGAKVINLSLGSATTSQVESDAIAYATGKGVLVVAAAGNGATSTPSYPAAYPQVVAVGATDAAGHRASFSQFGPWVTVGAPGTHITGTAPTAGSVFFPADYAVADGTSFSTPIVAAEAALLWSVRPGASAGEVRQAIVRSAHGYANLGLGAGQVDFRAAYDALAPESVPALTSPADGDTVSGAVPLSAASSAPKVRFLVDGTPLGAPVPTSDGKASTTWLSWGLKNAPHTVTAVDCSPSDVCSSQTSAGVGVTVDNAAPALTSPKPSQTLSGSATFSATAPGGAVAFLVDGVSRGVDTSAPYTLTYPVSSLADGTHTVQVVSCSATGALCEGPASDLVSFKALSLHPRFTAVSPSLFSPNADTRYDTTKATYYLPDTEVARIQIRNAAGSIVRGPLSLGTLAAGTHYFVWNGLLNGGTRAPSGTYRLELTTQRSTSSAVLSGFAAASVRVDMAAPTMSTVTGGGAWFYPYPDSYRDTFAPAFTLSEAATVTMTVRNSSGVAVRSFSLSRPAGRTSITWNGRNNAGALVPAGTYYWTLTAQDPAGNRRATARYSVGVSLRHLVTRTATVTLRGSQFLNAGGSDDSCSRASTTSSDFEPYGVWLANVCDSAYGLQLAAARYRFTVPAAISYTSLRLDSYGNSLAPSSLGAGFTRWDTGNYTFTREITTGTSNAWRTIGSVGPWGLVSSARQVETTVFVPNDYYRNDYDIGYVRLVVTYKVLG